MEFNNIINDIMILDENNNILGLNENFKKFFNSFKEIIEFSNILKEELFHNNSIIKYKDFELKYSKEPVLNLIEENKPLYYILTIIDIKNNNNFVTCNKKNNENIDDIEEMDFIIEND